MQYVQIVLTDAHVAYLREGLSFIAVDPETEGDRWNELRILDAFLEQVGEHPERFPVTGRMATAIKARLRKLKGPAQPPSRKNKRKARQERRMRTAKQARKTRRADAVAFNEARERVEADMAEWAEVQQERANRRNLLFSKDELTHDELAELFELIDLPHVAKHAREWHALTPQERLDLAAA